MALLSFDKLPDNALSVKPGPHKLTIVKAEKIIAKTGSEMLQLTYQVDDGSFRINFDNCVITDKEGNPNSFGQAKLKKILTATGTKPQGEFTIKSVAMMLIGKSFQADLEYDKAGKYLQLGTINSIVPLQDGEVTPVTPQSFVEKPEISEMVEDVDIEFVEDDEI